MLPAGSCLLPSYSQGNGTLPGLATAGTRPHCLPDALAGAGQEGNSAAPRGASSDRHGPWGSLRLPRPLSCPGTQSIHIPQLRRLGPSLHPTSLTR